MSDIWINKNTHGINLNILQIMAYLPIKITEFNFIEEKEENESISDSKYYKYIDLLNKGVSKECIEYKMNLDGLNSNTFNAIMKKKPKNILPNKQNLLKDITSGFKLKSFKKMDKPKIKQSKKYIIELKDILKRKSELRKT